MTLDQIKVLSAIAQTGSFRDAAELLHRTQPNLSVVTRNLEKEWRKNLDLNYLTEQITNLF